MHLRQIIIDGFKSYATRTVVSGFDPAFNAITGLNGSGKSNVLDSICFVLGITNLSQVRASSLQELVYKGGQAGVTKATVTLVFNNGDKATSPVGYEAFKEITVTRQIVIGGRNRYLINGQVSQPSRVQNLFHLVGLNVNNPHFLIMQGRITRVIAMKPPEMLAMVEEAAGTKMYENKKEQALKTIEKKARKVEEIDSLLTEKINPSLAKLEKERKHYMEWNQNNNDLESHARYVTAYDYFCAANVLNKSSAEHNEVKGALVELEESTAGISEERKVVEKEVSDLTRARAQLAGSNGIDDLEADVEQLDKKLTQTNGYLRNQRVALEAERGSVTALQKNEEESRAALKDKTADLEVAKAKLESAGAAAREASESVNAAETALLTGASSQNSQATGTGSAMDQLEAAKRLASAAKSELDSFKLRVAHLKKEHKDKSAKLASDRVGVRALEAEKKKMEKAIADAKLAVHELDFDENQAAALSDKLNEEKVVAARLGERVDQLSARFGAYEFEYANPKPNFDRRKVHGTVAKLFQVKDPSKATAIEVAAGGRLYQVVVDTDATATDIMKHGKLRKRVTILPLNKIKHPVLSREKVSRAKQLEPKCDLALHVVGYDADVSAALEHVFGRTLICPDMNSAKLVTFDHGVKTRSVTLEGDVYDPSGTLSGGSSRQGGGSSVLLLLNELAEAQVELATRSKNVQRLSAELSRLNANSKTHRQLTAALEIQKHQASLLDERLATSATGRLLSEVEALNKELSESIPAGMKAAKDSLKENEERINVLESELEDADSSRKRIQEEAETAMRAIKEAHMNALTESQDCKDAHDSLVVQIEALNDELNRLEQQRVEIVEPSVAKLDAEVKSYDAKVLSETSRFENVKERLENERARLAESDTGVARARKALDDLVEKFDSSILERNKLQSKLKEFERGRTSAEKLVARLCKEHKWIEQEEKHFNTAGSEYEFSKSKEKTARAALEKLRDRQDELSKKINKKSMHMFETAKDEYTSLVQKKRIIEEDKAKIQDVIAGLDEKKMVALERTWKEVNRSFGEIFSELLPGTSAKLEPPPGKTVESGLEIRVAFGATWKDSLSELSGGQRSLIALSLVLAMLRFKPAPMYILDEVDAALDLNHTQNIGRMLRKHFSGSQFIVVSLKDGMFNNANVLFRTRFVDGISTISKTVNAALQSAGDDSPLSSKAGANRSNIDNSSNENPRKQAGVAGRKRRAEN